MKIIKMNKSQAKSDIQTLSKKIKQYNSEYYLEDSPTISDAEYDQLFYQLKSLEEKFPEFLSKDSPTQNVGASVQDKFEKYEHKTPMLSLGNGFSEQDILDFIERAKRFLSIDYFPKISCEPKIDGVSFSLTYKEGKLVAGATRGDGYIGENITKNILTIKNLPQSIKNAPDLIEIRGEIYIDKQDFQQLNMRQEKNGKTVFANPRNCAAGSLRQLDYSITASRPLKYFVYATGHSSAEFASSQSEMLDKFKKMGFCVNPLFKLNGSMDEIIEFYNECTKNRDSLAYEVDGIVYKIDDFSLQKRLGFIARSPRFAIAHKFPAILAKTKLKDITIQVGRTGSLTPVAELEPINIGGVRVARATLHNFQEIQRLGLNIGDIVCVHRAGDVIPKITAKCENSSSSARKPLTVPTNCPSCGSKLHFHEDDVILRCDNGLNCPKQMGESIKHFVSKNALNIDGMGTKQVEFFLDKNLIKNPVDIFHLRKNNNESISKLENMPGWGAKSVEKLFDNIETSKTLSLPRFIYSLGIRHIGDSNAKILAKEFKTARIFFDSMIQLANKDSKTYAKLDNLDGIGSKILVDLQDFFDCQQNTTTIKSLLEILNIEDYTDSTNNQKLSGKNIVFTGSMKNISRSEAKAQAERLGAKVTSTVSTNTDILVAGEKAGSKLKKAEELGIKIISESDWGQLANDN